jgi:ABC-type dipeptide/oligopeptide/nickel transport system ATPase component
MYAGRIVESGDAATILDRPAASLHAWFDRQRAEPQQTRRAVAANSRHDARPAVAARRLRVSVRCAHADAACEVEPPSEPLHGRELRCFHPMDEAA